MFSFLQSYFLYALAAMSLPFIIHLLNKRKAKRIRFSTLVFLKQLQQKKMRRLKLRQLLLLLLRALIIAMFVLAFSRPTMKSQSFLLGQANVRTAAAIVLDNSMSMQYEGPQGLLYERGIGGAQQILEQFKPGDQIGLFLSCSISEYSTPQIFESSETVLQILSTSSATNRYGNLTETVSQAIAQLEKSIYPNKELYIISDFQKTSWPDFLKNEQIGSQSQIRTFLLDVGKNRSKNYSVKDVRLKNQIIEKGKTVTIAAKINNYSENDINDLMVHAFLLDKRVGQNSLNIENGKNRDVDFNLLIKQSGFVSGVIELEDDPLMLDNRGYFSFFLHDKIKLLLFGDSEDLRYFQLALVPNQSGRQLFSFENSATLQGKTNALSRYTAVVIADPDRLSIGEGLALAQYVKSGGHLIFFPGNRTDLRLVNERLFNVLGVPTFRETRGSIGDYFTFTQWGSINFSHPIFADIFREKVENIDSPKFYFRILLDPKSTEGSDIIKFEDNTPFLHLVNVGKGSVFLFSSALDPRWNDFVHKPIFPPLMFRTAIFIASQTQQNVLTSVLGEELVCEIFDPDAGYVLFRPDGVSEKIMPNRQGTSLQVKYNNAGIPGIYELKMNNNIIRQWAVNVNPLESDLEQIAIDEVNEILGDQVFELTLQDNFTAQVEKYRFGSEITRWFFLAALIFMLLEMLIGREDLFRNLPIFNRFFKQGTST